ncbi:acyltransferase family protein [Faecalimonas umbilicata]|uniref:acyltransferase family protein n=1 Tax=Faecalimonas umbilicata TaxID=1912855 RepID=UPI003990FD4A
MGDKERVLWLDYAKGLLIIFVVLGHVMPENALMHSWIYSWHMPAFFVLNGILLSYTQYVKKTVWGVVLQGIKKLMISYYVYGCFLMIARWWGSGFDIANLKWQLVDMFYLWGIGATWFLPCLFLAQLFYRMIKKISFARTFQNHKINLGIMFLIALSIMFVPFIIKANNVFVMVLFRSMIAAAFIVAGDLLSNVVKKIQKFSQSILFVGSACGLILSFTVFITTGKMQVSLNTLNVSPFVIYIVNALAGTIWIFIVAMSIEKSHAAIVRIVEFYGKSSMIVMGTHQVIMLILMIPIKMNYWLNFVYCIVVLLAEIPVIFLVNKIKSYGKESKWREKFVKYN